MSRARNQWHQAPRAHYLACYPGSPIGRATLLSKHLSNRSVRPGFQPGLQDGLPCGPCPAGSGGPARGRGDGRRCRRGGGVLFRGSALICGVQSWVLFRDAVLHLASPKHLAKESLPCGSSLSQLARPRFHHPRLRLPVADNGWCWVTQFNRSVPSLDHPSHG